MPVDDPDRAEGFYTAVFGWKFERFPGAPQYYGMVTTGADAEPGINGGLFQRGDAGKTSITMDVESIEDTLKTVEKEGGKILQPKAPIPGMGWFATCEDTEGNTFGLFTNDPNAA